MHVDRCVCVCVCVCVLSQAQALLLADTGSTLPGSAPVAAQLAARGTSIASFVAGSGGRGGAGRGVVPAARFAERLLQDIGSWSMAMPAFESSFMGTWLIDRLT